MTGNIVSNLHEPPLFLLDESLSPTVANALKLVGYNFVTVRDAFSTRGVLDPDIIGWCQGNAATWVHADDQARKAYRALLQTSGIRTVWLYREKGRMSSKEQLRILSFVLPKVLDNRTRSSASRHYRAGAANPLATPSLRPVNI